MTSEGYWKAMIGLLKGRVPWKSLCVAYGERRTVNRLYQAVRPAFYLYAQGADLMGTTASEVARVAEQDDILPYKPDLMQYHDPEMYRRSFNDHWKLLVSPGYDKDVYMHYGADPSLMGVWRRHSPKLERLVKIAKVRKMPMSELLKIWEDACL